MTRDEAITAEVHRYATAAADHQTHLAHVRLLALRRLRDPGHDAARIDTDSAGDRMFGDNHNHLLAA